MMGLLEALGGSAKKASSCFIKTCICGDVLKGVNKIFSQTLLCHKSRAGAQTTLLGVASDLSPPQAAAPAVPSRVPGDGHPPDLGPCTFGKAGCSPRPQAKGAEDGGLRGHRLVLGRLCLLTASGIKAESHFYEVISNLVFLLGRLRWPEQRRCHWLGQSSGGDGNLICAFPSLLLISRFTAGIWVL